jgi:hypothetical protein
MIDVPIGLPEWKYRRCDLEARKLFGSSVFLGLGGTFVPSDPIKKPTPIIGHMVTPASQNSIGAFVTAPRSQRGDDATAAITLAGNASRASFLAS